MLKNKPGPITPGTEGETRSIRRGKTGITGSGEVVFRPCEHAPRKEKAGSPGKIRSAGWNSKGAMKC